MSELRLVLPSGVVVPVEMTTIYWLPGTVPEAEIEALVDLEDIGEQVIYPPGSVIDVFTERLEDESGFSVWRITVIEGGKHE